ncbi:MULTISPECIES: NADH-quinone oxidoreductase subunit NuoH [Pelosinus]|uniref:NADH-quinone oxidoreductase subunit H n=1 Tax=Pelosinus fermentans B4 TaxID=1149862 RepID=I8RBL8_9FIRM|nr:MULTISPECIES: NADH-quinone oxidoreductase subunit NuoH [Pelosinus]MDF2570414.1 NAD(P)H-quinone oxidoreductase subunit 1 [Sporomusa sp.]EIW16418.1 respiratory-chain NADH dehydrogenase subunit 1 [Pelosinus fermentans B4]EIW22601.1 NAD(P)H-quinone oxidoreductase subunit 1 [Pelosinus fermentans A11]OAM95725.1 NAD(P)H-quinone oxidoreductase subunit 1 [Pelosinus fermentans DSM 17108]SDR32066.1 NADH-quinone oxidoreductase subunit H [Pelosinus fermentans]
MQEVTGLFMVATMLRNILGKYLPNPQWVDIVITLINIGAIFTVISLSAVILVYAERKVSAYMQMRIGPNRVGPWGILQTVADMIKLMSKEDIMPVGADRWLWILAPVLLFIPSAAVYVVFPFDNQAIFADLNIGIFYFIAVSSQATLPFLMAGWASNSKYALIGGMRTVAQMLSYEIPLVFSILGVVMIVGSMRMSDIVAAQQQVWFIVVQPLAFIIFLIAATAETNRAPFDLVESESELVAGPFTEYSGMRWALFFLAEYANLFAASAIAVTLFLGGWNGPWLPGWLWFLLKTALMIFVFMWLRWTFPRPRVDQLMAFGWKILLPLSLVNVVLTGIGIYTVKYFS